jgi:redox-sensitive bicupin YhaK (pirin superfamily)
LHADARLLAGLFDGNETAEVAIEPGRLAYVHLARGALDVNGQRLSAGDGALLRDESRVSLSRGIGAEVLVFDLAP